MNPISTIKEYLGTGLPKAKYKIILNVPVSDSSSSSLSKSTNAKNNKELDVLCTNVSFPTRKVSNLTAWYRGRKYNIRSLEENQDNLTITVMEKPDCSIRKLFENWLVGVDSQVNNKLWKNYTTTMKVIQLNNDLKSVFGYEFTDCFVSEIGSVEFSNSSINEVVSYTVTFVYSKCYPISNPNEDD